jgi:hypothetical protein
LPREQDLSRGNGVAGVVHSPPARPFLFSRCLCILGESTRERRISQCAFVLRPIRPALRLPECHSADRLVAAASLGAKAPHQEQLSRRASRSGSGALVRPQMWPCRARARSVIGALLSGHKPKTSPAYAVLSQSTRRVFAAIKGSSKPLKVVRHICRRHCHI